VATRKFLLVANSKSPLSHHVWRGLRTAAGEGWVSESVTSATPSALTPVAVQLRTVEVRWAIPRRIHGVRLAISATARSERRIAVRGLGVGVDTSCASASRKSARSAVSWREPHWAPSRR
jgi:hypothetical protein